MKSVLERTRLPEGFRDFGPEAAQAITNMTARLDRVYSRWGFQRVLTPSIEAEEVLRPGLGPRAAADAFPLVDPLTGQRLLYRPDITPQVARMVAAGAAGEDLPIKLFYRGSIVRQRHSGAYGAREIYQSGVENFNPEAELADAETVALCLEAARAAGLRDSVLELGDIRFVDGILESLPLSAEARAALTSAIDRKDRAEIAEIVRETKLPAKSRQLLEALPGLFGGREVFEQAKKLAVPDSSKRAIASLEKLVRTLEAAGADLSRVEIDLAEIRGLDYYTGLLFAVYAKGAAKAVLSGGRYDHLAAAFGRDIPAVGFAADVELLARLGDTSETRHGDLASADIVLFAEKGAVGEALLQATQLRAGGKRVLLAGIRMNRAAAKARAKSLGAKLVEAKAPKQIKKKPAPAKKTKQRAAKPAKRKK